MIPSLQFAQDVVFMGLTIWREGRNEPFDGKLAIAHSIINRVRRPSWWGSTVLSVLTKKWQYSSLTDPNDKQLTWYPIENDPRWVDCLEAARGAYDGTAKNPAPGADSYYADGSIPPPKWADPKKFVVKIGNHSFYNLDSDHELDVG